MELDFSRTPIGTDEEVVIEGLVISEFAEQFEDEGRFRFTVFAETGLAQIWMLMPEDRTYEHFEIRVFQSVSLSNRRRSFRQPPSNFRLVPSQHSN